MRCKEIFKSMAWIVMVGCMTSCGMEAGQEYGFDELYPVEQEVINGSVCTDAAHEAVGQLRMQYCDGFWDCLFGWHTGYCSGSLITPDVILTAAHCVAELGDHESRQVAFRLDGDSWISAKRWIWLTGWKSGDTVYPQHDLALVILKSNITDVTTAMVMESDDAVAIDNVLTIVGYGCTEWGKSTGSGTKRHGDAPVDSLSSNVITLTRADDLNNDAAGCHGDSGGPSFKSFSDGKTPLLRITGVNSTSTGTITNQGYLRTSRTSFINYILADRCDNGDRDSSICDDWRTLPVPVPTPTPTCQADYRNCLLNSDCCSGKCVCVGVMGNTIGYCCPKGQVCKFC